MSSFTIPGRLPGMNEIIDAARSSRYTSAEMKKVNTEFVAWCVKKARLPKMTRINLTISWYEPNDKRDTDNVHAGVKFILDGLVMAGVLRNDGRKQIAKITHEIFTDKDNPRVEVEIKEA